MIKKLFNSSLFQETGIYAFSSMLNSAIPFFLLPILTRYLTPEDYGILAMFAVLVGIFRPFTGLNVKGAIKVKYFDRGNIDLPIYIGNCFYVLFVSTLFLSGVVWLFADQLSNLSAFPKSWLWSVVIVSSAQFVIMVLMLIWQVQKKPIHYGVYQILQTLSSMGITIFLVVVLSKNWQGKIVAQIITASVFAGYGIFWLYKNGLIKFSYNKSYLKNALKFGIPLIPHSLGGMLMTYTDRAFITNMVGIESTGIYTVGWQVSSIVGLLATSFNNAYVPWLYERLSKNDCREKVKIVRYTYYYFVLIMVFALSLSLLVPPFLKFLVGEKFVSAGVYILWITMGYAFSGMYLMVANYIFYAEKTHLLAWVTFFTALANIVFNYFLIKKNGPLGAAQATALAFFMSFVLTWVLSAKVYKMPWSLIKSLR